MTSTVTYNRQGNTYGAAILHNGERFCLGSIHTPEEAALHVARWIRDYVLAYQIALKAVAAAAPPPPDWLARPSERKRSG